MADLAGILSATAARPVARPAVRLDDAVLTYRELDDAVARCAGLLRAAGVGAGDRAGVMLPNIPGFPIAYYGAPRLGASVVAMNVLLKEREPSSSGGAPTCVRGRSRRCSTSTPVSGRPR